MISEKQFFSQGFGHQSVYHIHYIFLGVFFPKQSYVWGKCIPQQVLAEGNSIISNRWKTWDRERSIFYENPEHFSYKSLHMHCIVIAKINQYFLFLFQLWTVRQPNPRRQKRHKSQFKGNTQKYSIVWCETLFWFEKFDSETKLSVWWVKLDHCIDQTCWESHRGNLEVLAKMETHIYPRPQT